MKEIKATIHPHMLSRVVNALEELPHFPGLTHFRCQGLGRGRGEGGAYIPSEELTQFDPKERIEIMCTDEVAESIVELIRTRAHTGTPGDGIITIAEVAQVMRIRTGETGTSAV